MRRSKVLDIQLQDQLYDHLKKLKPLPSIYFPDFIAANQVKEHTAGWRGGKRKERCLGHCPLTEIPSHSYGGREGVRWAGQSPMSESHPHLMSSSHPPQAERADNVLTGTKQEQMEQVRKQIRDFKTHNHLDKVGRGRLGALAKIQDHRRGRGRFRVVLTSTPRLRVVNMRTYFAGTFGVGQRCGPVGSD